jgi:hypothetical protein
MSFGVMGNGKERLSPKIRTDRNVVQMPKAGKQMRVYDDIGPQVAGQWSKIDPHKRSIVGSRKLSQKPW